MSNPSEGDMAGLDGPGKELILRRGQVLYRQGDRVDQVFFLQSGRVHLVRNLRSDRRLDLGTIEPGSFLGNLSLFGVTIVEETAEATEDCRIRVMRAADIDRVVREQPRVALLIVETLSTRLVRIEERLEEMAYRSVPARVAAVLVHLSDGRDDQVIRITHQELGNMVGALRETVTKILAAFEAAGIVELGRGRIVIRNVASLRARFDESGVATEPPAV